MNFVSSHEWTDHIDLIEGEPDAPWKALKATCVICWRGVEVGRYRYTDDPVELADGTVTTYEDWRAEHARNAISRTGPRRHKLHCPMCDLVTDHVAELS